MEGYEVCKVLEKGKEDALPQLVKWGVPGRWRLEYAIMGAGRGKADRPENVGRSCQEIYASAYWSGRGINAKAAPPIRIAELSTTSTIQ